MGEEKKDEILSQLRENEEVYVVFSTATRCPYVVCDPETCDDEIFLYLTGEAGKQAEERLKESQVPVSLITLKKKLFLYFYTSLYTMGVNAVMVNGDKGNLRLQLEDIVKRKLPEEKKDGPVWVENPELQLTAIYLMQEMRRTSEHTFSREHREMLEEIAAHMSRGRLIQPVANGQKAIPMLKLKNGEKYQPMFTDILEFQKFNREKQYQAVVVEAAKLPRILAPDANGVVLNPLGVNLPLKIDRTKTAPGGAAKAQADS